MSVPRFNLPLAWRRLYKLMTPMTKTMRKQYIWLGYATFATWPAIALFTKYTLELDDMEHHAREKLVNKNMPYMNNPGGVVFTWGTPCNLFDFGCAYKHRQAQQEEQ